MTKIDHTVLLCGRFSSLSSNFRSFPFLAGFALFPKSRKVTKIDHTVKLKIFKLSRFLWFLAAFALPSKFRNGTKIDHTVWPPPINRRKKRKDSAFHSGRVQVLLWCRLCQTATIIIWPLGKRRKRPKPKPTAAAATPNEPKGAKRTRRRHSVQHHHTHTQALGAMPPHTQRSHSVHANSLSFRSARPERKDSDFRGVALPSIGLRVSRKLRAPRRRICEYLVWSNTEYLV